MWAIHNIPQHSFERTNNIINLMFSALTGFYQMNRKKKKEKKKYSKETSLVRRHHGNYTALRALHRVQLFYFFYIILRGLIPQESYLRTGGISCSFSVRYSLTHTELSTITRRTKPKPTKSPSPLVRPTCSSYPSRQCVPKSRMDSSDNPKSAWVEDRSLKHSQPSQAFGRVSYINARQPC